MRKLFILILFPGVLSAQLDKRTIEIVDSVVRSVIDEKAVKLDPLIVKIDSIVRAAIKDEPTEKPIDGVKITTPTNGQSFQRGETVTVNLKTAGNFTTHRIFVNGDLKDTDGATYTPYKIENIKQGVYLITAEATDPDGLAVKDEVQIKVN